MGFKYTLYIVYKKFYISINLAWSILELLG